jgi:hypothetical protein
MNFVRVLILWFVSGFSWRNPLGGELQGGNLNFVSGHSVKAQCTGKPSYLEPISGSLHVPIEGLLARSFPCLNKEEGVSNREQQNLLTATRRTRKDSIHESNYTPIHAPMYCPKYTMTAKTTSLGMKLSARNVETRVFRSPQTNARSSTGKTGVNPNIT